jgi:hypothetical protein
MGANGQTNLPTFCQLGFRDMARERSQSLEDDLSRGRLTKTTTAVIPRRYPTGPTKRPSTPAAIQMMATATHRPVTYPTRLSSRR